MNVKSSRRQFLATTATVAAAPLPATSAHVALDGFEIARRNCIVRDLPTPNFFEGMLLGNGDIGACVTVRPDALGLHLGKEDAWDIRVSLSARASAAGATEALERGWERG